MSRRKVIFPPADFWTQPKEQPMSDPNRTDAGDYRRAAVITLHHRQGSTAGVAAIVDETNEAGRAAHLLMAVLQFNWMLITNIRTADGLALLNDYISIMSQDGGDADLAQAAQLHIAHRNNNHTTIGEIMADAAKRRRVTNVFMAVLALYTITVPELSSDEGLAWIERQIQVLANEEVQ